MLDLIYKYKYRMQLTNNKEKIKRLKINLNYFIYYLYIKSNGIHALLFIYSNMFIEIAHSNILFSTDFLCLLNIISNFFHKQNLIIYFKRKKIFQSVFISTITILIIAILL